MQGDDIPSEILERTRDSLVFGHRAAAEALLEGLVDCAPEEREPILRCVEWFEAQADRLEKEDV